MACRGLSMIAETYEGSKERSVLIGVITSRQVLGVVTAHWDGKLFASPWSNLIAQWCVDFYTSYKDAPGKGIVGLFEDWQASHPAETETAGLVSKLLSSISDEYAHAQEINVGHLIDVAGHYFNKVRLKRLRDEIEDDLTSNRLDKGLTRVADFSRVQIGKGSVLSPLGDREVIRAHFDSPSNETLIDYPGALGDFFGRSLCRSGMVTFMAPEKVGKSFWLLDLAVRAVEQRRRVVFFEAGDNSLGDVLDRLYSRVANHPSRPGRGGWPHKVKYPTTVEKKPKEKWATVTHEEKTFDRPLTEAVTWKHCQDFLRKRAKSRKDLFRLSCHSNSTLNVQGIRSVLESLELDGFVPDVIVIDYADILAHPVGHRETRDQVNEVWKQLRALSQDAHCLLAIGTQADADSYGKESLDRRNFSEDKRKLAHATGVVGINLTGEEKERGVCRLNWIVRRSEDYSPRRHVHVAGCLALAQPAVLSTF